MPKRREGEYVEGREGEVSEGRVVKRMKEEEEEEEDYFFAGRAYHIGKFMILVHGVCTLHYSARNLGGMLCSLRVQQSK